MYVALRILEAKHRVMQFLLICINSSVMMLADNPKVYPIEAGDEPIEFKTLFPFWVEREDVKRHHIQVSLVVIHYTVYTMQYAV